MRALRLARLPGTYAVARRAAADPVPPGLFAVSGLVSVTRTADELSILAPEAALAEAGVAPGPDGPVAGGWAAFAVEGPLDFGEVGVMARLSAALAGAGISLFAVSTYDTDYILVAADRAGDAAAAWAAEGHRVD